MDWTGSWVTKARLLNVCIGGAFIVTLSVVAPGQKLHVRLANVPEIGWIDVHVVHVERGSSDMFKKQTLGRFKKMGTLPLPTCYFKYRWQNRSRR
jgi:hypothetical protein